MAVNRRYAIKQLLFVATGLAILPSCLQNTTRTSMTLKELKLDGDMEKTLAELVDTIIPPTSTPGAKEVGAHLFTILMLDDCYKKEEQERWVNGFKAFEELSKKRNGDSFLNSSQTKREGLVASLEANKDDKDDLNYFYRTTKRLTIQAYTSSKYFLTNVNVYELVPGRYKGCVPYKPQPKKLS